MSEKNANPEMCRLDQGRAVGFLPIIFLRCLSFERGTTDSKMCFRSKGKVADLLSLLSRREMLIAESASDCGVGSRIFRN